MTSGFYTRERNQQGEHELTFEERLDSCNLRERRFKSGGVCKPSGVGGVMLSVHAFAAVELLAVLRVAALIVGTQSTGISSLACFVGGELFATFTSRRREVGDRSRRMSKLPDWAAFVKQFAETSHVHCIQAILGALSTHALLAVQTCCFITPL
ncbi:hypothetical protein Q8A73_016287 [Channa argus]|nr:hypothetical protein Q8A73_016287 [Channa argus]